MTFWEAAAEYVAERDRCRGFETAERSAYDIDCLAFARDMAKRKRHRRKIEKADDARVYLTQHATEEEIELLRSKWAERVAAVHADQERIATLQKRMIDSAREPASLMHRARERWIDVEWFYRGAYSSQTQSAHYHATAMAAKVDECQKAGYEARVCPERGDTVQVLGQDESDGLYCRHHHAMTVRDWAQFVMRRGCNIRVFHPMLPYGIEQQWGLDYLGNDLKVTP